MDDSRALVRCEASLGGRSAMLISGAPSARCPSAGEGIRQQHVITKPEACPCEESRIHFECRSIRDPRRIVGTALRQRTRTWLHRLDRADDARAVDERNVQRNPRAEHPEGRRGWLRGPIEEEHASLGRERWTLHEPEG